MSTGEADTTRDRVCVHCGASNAVYLGPSCPGCYGRTLADEAARVPDDQPAPQPAQAEAALMKAMSIVHDAAATGHLSDKGRAALLAALGHTDCVPRGGTVYVKQPDGSLHLTTLSEANRDLTRAERAEAELAEVHRVLDEGSVEPGGTAAIVAQREDERDRLVEENDALTEQRDRLRAWIRHHDANRELGRCDGPISLAVIDAEKPHEYLADDYDQDCAVCGEGVLFYLHDALDGGDSR